ncbi:MAG: site-2 protease family protein [Candidatus Roizmanbacteria bacterium]
MLDIITKNPLLGLIYILVLVFCITIHEFAHAIAADKLGDPTPRLQGRITLNPLAHLDPLGSILMVFTGFGWGRAVVFDPYNLENPRQDGMKIALAGPAINIAVALVCSALLKLTPLGGVAVLGSIIAMVIQVNLSLALFNLIPVEPLDGFKIVNGLLSKEQSWKWETLRPYGFYILIALSVPLFGPAPIGLILTPLLRFLLGVLL